VDSRSVGQVEVLALRDARGAFGTWTEQFPDVTERQWALARAADPAAFGDDEAWVIDFRAFAVRTASGVVLVDTGIGPADAPASSWAPVPGRLPTALAEVGIAPADVRTVVLTHLHSDHTGWAVGADGVPTFPNARYVVQRAETEWLDREFADGKVHAWALRPLRAAGALDEVDGSTVLGTGRGGETVTAFHTPGHTPGHQSVVVSGDGLELVVTGDVLVHTLQLLVPSVRYDHEVDPALAATTRRALLDRAAETGAVLATSHLTKPFVTVPTPTAPHS
jgi:glyoxylase-like metal-dependent hydrolase (beta-lactamase superfamily II)